MTKETKPACCAAGRMGSGSLAGAEFKSNRQPGEPWMEGMVWIPGGIFLFGAEDGQGFLADGEGPVRKVTLDPFRIDACAVTNA